MEETMTRGEKLLLDMRTIKFFGKPFAEVVAQMKEGRKNIIRSFKEINYSAEQIAELTGYDSVHIKETLLEFKD